MSLRISLECKKKYLEPGTMIHTYNPNTQETEAEGSRIQGHPGYTRSFETILVYNMTLSTKTKHEKEDME